MSGPARPGASPAPRPGPPDTAPHPCYRRRAPATVHDRRHALTDPDPRRTGPVLATALAALMALVSPAAAQEAASDAEAPAADPADADAGSGAEAPAAGDEAAEGEAAPGGGDGLSLGEPVTGAPDQASAGEGETYVREEFTDWQMRCVRSADGAPEPCQLYQLLRDAQDNPVAEISMFGLPSGGQAAAGATVITPLETLLTEQVTVAVDDAQAKRYPFTWCSAIGCFARIGFTEPEIAAFRRGNEASISIRPVAAPDQEVVLSMSLSGFTAGLNAVNANNDTARAAEE